MAFEQLVAEAAVKKEKKKEAKKEKKTPFGHTHAKDGTGSSSEAEKVAADAPNVPKH